MLDFELGEMKAEDGSSLRYEVEAGAAEYAIRISQMIESTSIFKRLAGKIPSRRLSLYFEYIIKKEIFPFVLQGCLIQWYKRNNRYIPPGEEVVKVPAGGIFLFLKECWDFEDIRLKLVNSIFFNFMYQLSFKKVISSNGKKYIKKLDGILGRFTKDKTFSRDTPTIGTIACHYNEGIDLTRRNDLDWFSGSCIDPSRVLIYFDHLYATPPSAKTGNLVKKEIIQQIEEQGFRWVALERNVIENQGLRYWVPPRLPANYIIEKNMGKNRIEKWIIDVADVLLERVHYWRSFYDEFNIVINYISEEGFADNIIQAIAFDIGEEKAGVLIGKQRSEFYPLQFAQIGYHPKHVFFVWNNRYLHKDYDRIKALVVSGHPNVSFERLRTSHQNMSAELKSKGVKFVMALFDNAYGPLTAISKNELTKFYRDFLGWLIEDSDIGLIIKSKKPYVIENLRSIYPALKKSIETGRCIRIEDVLNRLPSEASAGVDMAIGIGISSALIEAVIAGSRGILYDVTCCRDSEFYRWGNNLVIFDKLEKMMMALRNYKADVKNEPKLGDWSAYLDNLDPFRDGRSGERMGEYMRWLLKSLDNGASQDEAILCADRRYREKWGIDKAIVKN